MRQKKQINVEVGERIKQYRERAGMTQERLSEILDVSTNHLSEIERGLSGVSLLRLKELCDVLCVSADQLLMGGKGKNDVAFLSERLAKLEPIYFDKLVEIINSYLEAVAIKKKE